MVFAGACLSKPVLNLRNGSTFEEASTIPLQVGNLFAKFEKMDLADGLKGTPTYEFARDQKSGKFTCYVLSKDLTLDDVLLHFENISKIAGAGEQVSEEGPAKFDDNPEHKIQGKERFFRSEGRVLDLTAFFYVSPRGPLGGYLVEITNNIAAP